MSEKNAKVTVYYPNSNIILSEGEIDSEGRLNGEFNVYNNDSSKTPFKKMTFANGKLISSQMIIGNKLRNINISDNSLTSITLRNASQFLSLLGIHVEGATLKFDGTSSTIYGTDVTIDTTLSDNNGTPVSLLKVSVESKNGIVLESNYKDVGTSEYILDTKLINRNKIDLINKVYSSGNIVKPIYMKVKNINQDEIHSTFKGSQVPSLGEIENLN